MKLKLHCFFSLFLLLLTGVANSQDVTLYQQFNGRYDFTFVGNTLNPEENSYLYPSYMFTSSSADLNLGSSDVIEKAYLYWAGSGTGDFDVKLNGIDIRADRTFATRGTNYDFDYFSAFKDVTSIVQTAGNATYTLSELDLNYLVSTYNENGTNFGGWAIIVIYKNNSLPLNALNIYDGLERISPINNQIATLTININNLNVIDDIGSKIGFIAWEGDRALNYDESLKINGITLSNALNPPTNAFNGTNSVTNSSVLYNMDLDIYDIQNNIQIGDTSAEIKLTSSRDYVMINAIVTKLNSQLPDATVVIDNAEVECSSRNVFVKYTVHNTNCTNPLPAGTTISIYADGVLVGNNVTQNIIPIDGSETFNQVIAIPNGIPGTFNIKIIVDEQGLVTELLENNNESIIQSVTFTDSTFNPPADLISCNRGSTEGLFDFSAYENTVATNANQHITFHESQEDANSGDNPIIDTTNYLAVTTPKRIFVRIYEQCYTTTSFLLTVRPCPPIVYNAVSVNGDGMNDTFYIEGLRDVFVNFELFIYNRWGKQVWTGNNNTPDWDGYIKDGIGSTMAPDGTYFYILYLNDPNYPDALKGYLYLNH